MDQVQPPFLAAIERPCLLDAANGFLLRQTPGAFFECKRMTKGGSLQKCDFPDNENQRYDIR